jgi:putative endonuclease
VKLVFSEIFENAYDAFSAERQMKRWSRAKKIALIQGDFSLLHDLSECKNKTHFANKGLNDI